MYSTEQWLRVAHENRLAAEELNNIAKHRACVNRCYYAAYQTVTAVCIAHGDATHFPPDWNNPTHEQLPGLVLNNGDLPQSERRKIARLLRSLRVAREDADYRPGHTVDKATALDSLRDMLAVRRLLKVEDD